MLTGLKHYGWVMWRSLWIILAGVVVCTGITYVLNKRETPMYDSVALIQVNSSVSADNNNVFTDQALAQGYALLVNNPEVLQAVAQKIPGVDPVKLSSAVSATPQNDTQVIAIHVHYNDAQLTADIANQIAETFIQIQTTKATAQLQIVQNKLAKDLASAKRARDDAQAQLTALQNNHATQSDISHQEDVFNSALATYNSIQASYNDVNLQLYRVTSGFTIVSRALPAQEPISPKTTTNTLVAALLSFLLLAILMLLLDWSNVTIRTTDDVQNLLQLEALGKVPAIRTEAKEPLNPFKEKNEALEQAFATIGMNFSALEKSSSSVTVMGLQPGAGTSTTALNLALALTQAGMRVLLVDANLVRPSLHEVFRRANEKGLTNSLTEVHMFQEQQDSVTSWLHQWSTSTANLWILPSGPKPPTSTMVLRAPELKTLLGWLLPGHNLSGNTSGVVDFVIFDTSALSEGPGALEVASVTHSSILVVEAGKEQVESLRKAEQALQKLHSTLLGVVVNRQTPKHHSYLYTEAYQKAKSPVKKEIVNPVPLASRPSANITRTLPPQILKPLPSRRFDGTPPPSSPFWANEANVSHSQIQRPPLKIEG